MVRGTAALLFGLLALAWPVVTLFFLVVLFSAYTLAVGGMAIVAALKRTTNAVGGWCCSSGEPHSGARKEHPIRSETHA